MKALAYFARPLATMAPRDLLLLEFLQPRPTDVALEIGTGSGSSVFRLAGSVARLHSVDISSVSLERIRRILARREEPLRSVRLIAMDFCDPGAPARLPTRYDLIFSCDTLEHVPNPGRFLANIYQALNPGGRIFVAYPNEQPARAHGITFFERRQALLDLLLGAGFSREQIQINVFRMTRGAEQLLDAGWRVPRRYLKRALKWARRRDRFAPALDEAIGPAAASVSANSQPSLVGPISSREEPQTFDRTDFFNMARRLEPMAPLINAYCWALMTLMSLRGPVYQIFPAPEIIWDCSILIRAARSRDESH